jgi:hypothetical protein
MHCILSKGNTLLPPPESLGAENAMSELHREVLGSSRSHPAINSVVAPSGTISVTPVTALGGVNNLATTTMAIQPIAAVAASSSIARNVRHQTTNHTTSDNDCFGCNGALCDLSSLFDMMQRNNCILLQQSYHKIQADYESPLASLNRARSDNDNAHMSFYKMAYRNLLEELRSMSAN